MKSIDLIVLERWQELNNSVGIRARIIIMYLQGVPKDEISTNLHIPKRIVSLWIVRYVERGLSGLMDEQRHGRRVHFKKLKAIYNFLEKSQGSTQNESIEVFSKRIKRSPDIIWKSARMLGLTPQKKIKRDFKVAIHEDWKETGLVGIFLDSSIIIAAYVEDSESYSNLKNAGKWLNPHFKKYINPSHLNELSLSNVIRKFNDIDIKPFTKRATSELWKRWANEILYAEPMIAKSVVLKVFGNYCDDLIFKSLRLSHQTRPLKSKSRLQNIDIPEINISFFDSIYVNQAKPPFTEFEFLWLIRNWQEMNVESKCFAWCRLN